MIMRLLILVMDSYIGRSQALNQLALGNEVWKGHETIRMETQD